MTWTINSVLTWATEDFARRGMDKPRLEAEVLLAHVLDCSRLTLYTDFSRPLIDDELAKYREAIVRRRSGEPTAYITGRKEFWSLDFFVNEHVLVPRPETEHLVEAALDRAPRNGRFLDLATGTGCVAIALAHEIKDIEVDATDISEEACHLAKRNALFHSVSDRLHVFLGDLFAPLPEGSCYDAITANPPYVPNSEIAALPSAVQYEPRLALAGGPDGLDIVRRIIKEAPLYLRPSGWLFVEIDPRQAKVVAGQLGPLSFEAPGDIIRDLAGGERIVAFRASPK